MNLHFDFFVKQKNNCSLVMDHDNTTSVIDPDYLYGPQVIQEMIKKPGMLMLTE